MFINLASALTILQGPLEIHVQEDKKELTALGVEQAWDGGGAGGGAWGDIMGPRSFWTRILFLVMSTCLCVDTCMYVQVP